MPKQCLRRSQSWLWLIVSRESLSSSITVRELALPSTLVRGLNHFEHINTYHMITSVKDEMHLKVPLLGFDLAKLAMQTLDQFHSCASSHAPVYSRRARTDASLHVFVCVHMCACVYVRVSVCLPGCLHHSDLLVSTCMCV